MYEGCRSEAELTHINENYVVHGMECVGSAEVQVIRSWGLTQSSIISESVIWTNSSNFCSEREFESPIEAFYSKLNLLGIIGCDYGHAQRVWREFGMKDLGDYHDLHLKTDMLLLSNAFETFKNKFFRTFCPQSGSLLHLSQIGLAILP